MNQKCSCLWFICLSVMTKKECRKIYREKRRQLTLQQIRKLDDLMLINFQKIDLPFIQCAHTYLPLEKENEPDTSACMRYLQFRNPGMIMVVPKIDVQTENIQQVILTENTNFIINSYGIEEPETNDVVAADETDIVLVPLICFDKKGFRVGYGKGFYDKFLSDCREDVIKVGFSYFDPVESIDDSNEFDIPLNYCITPESVYEF